MATETDTAALVARALAAVEDVVEPDGYSPVSQALWQAAADGAGSLGAGRALLDPQDATARAVGCELLGFVADRHEALRPEVLSSLLALVEEERAPDVLWRAAKALGATYDPQAVPVLAALAGHSDPDVRLQVACALPSVPTGDPAGEDVRTMIALTRDLDPQVRNWATFGLGFLAEIDTPEIRAALAERMADPHAETREEGIRGLARRHDPRAVAPLAGLLDDEDGAHVLTFDAAAILGVPELLPHLEQYDPADTGVADALAACDPQVRELRDRTAWALLGAVDRRAPALAAALSSERFDHGLTLTATVSGDVRRWDPAALLERAGGDPEAAAALVLADTARA